MKENQFRRFSSIEVILHGVNTVIYFSLFATGFILLLQRFLEIEWLPHKTLSIIHRITGIILVIYYIHILFLSFVVPSYRVVWKTISEALSWKIRDFVWLLKAPFHFLFHRIALPPSGKYNPGQKLNILVVMFTISGLSLSGLLMMIFPGILIVWYIHIFCFLPGAALLLVHLYLSLVNPPTRKAIKGIVTGYVSTHYVKEHHQLCFDEPISEKNHVHFYRYPVVLVGFLVLVILFIGINGYGSHKLRSQVSKLVQSRGMIAMVPGPLTLNHANATDYECMRCHNLLSAPCSEKCTSCHNVIANRIKEKSGHHGQFKDECINCHREHMGEYADICQFDKNTFNHHKANFKLKGKHIELDCEHCHRVHDASISDENIVKMRYINIDLETCRNCHANYQHEFNWSSNCLICHSE